MVMDFLTFNSVNSVSGPITPAAEPHTSVDGLELLTVDITNYDWFDFDRLAADQDAHGLPDEVPAMGAASDAPFLHNHAPLSEAFALGPPHTAYSAFGALYPPSGTFDALLPPLSVSFLLPTVPDTSTYAHVPEIPYVGRVLDPAIVPVPGGSNAGSRYVAPRDVFPSPPSLPAWLPEEEDGCSSTSAQVEDAIIPSWKEEQDAVQPSLSPLLAREPRPVTRGPASEQKASAGPSAPRQCKRKLKVEPEEDKIWPAPPKKARCASTPPAPRHRSRAPSPPSLFSTRPTSKPLAPIVVIPEGGLHCPMPGCAAPLAPTDAAWRSHFRSAHHGDVCREPGCKGDCKRACPLPKESCDKCTVVMSTDSLGRHLLNIHVNLRHRCPVCGEERAQRRSSCQRHIQTCLRNRGGAACGRA